MHMLIAVSPWALPFPLKVQITFFHFTVSQHWAHGDEIPGRHAGVRPQYFQSTKLRFQSYKNHFASCKCIWTLKYRE